MTVVKAAAIQLSPVLYSREGTVEKIVIRILELGRTPGPRILRLVVGNPLIMKDMVESVPDAASYAPVTLLVDERADGVHLSYDTMASLLSPYGSEAALSVARDLDNTITGLLEMTATHGSMR